MKNINQLLKGTILFVGLVFGASAFAQKGYVNFDDLSKSYGEPKVEINLGGAIMGLIGGFAQEEDPEVAAMMKSLESVRVRVYNTKGDATKALQTVDKVTKQLRSDNWQPIVSVNEENEKVRIYSRYTKDKMDGLVVMVVDGSADPDASDNSGKGEVVFINIVGEIDPKNISKVTNSLNIDIN